MTSVRTERAHAKINLLLRILAREASGYHGIETLFQRVALHDVVRVDVSPSERTLHCDGPAMPAAGFGAPEQNLAWRAASLYADAARWPSGWHIAIDKQIPVGGGLGGGSADAAAVLRAFESLCPTPLGRAAVLELAGTLGADVPFCVADISRAWGWGRGDRLLPLAPLAPMPVTLVAFDAGVHTAQAYGAVAAARAAEHHRIVAHAYGEGAFATWASICELAVNDFEQVVPTMHPGVAAILPELRGLAGAIRQSGQPACALMSGSGATCFLLHPDGTLVEPMRVDGSRLVRTATY